MAAEQLMKTLDRSGVGARCVVGGRWELDLSVQAMGWVLDHSVEKGNRRLVLLSLANHADKVGENAYPSVTTIAKEAGCSQATAKACLAGLRDDGIITIAKNMGDGLRRKTNRYTILAMRPEGPEVGSSEPVQKGQELAGLDASEGPTLDSDEPRAPAQMSQTGSQEPKNLEPKDRTVNLALVADEVVVDLEQRRKDDLWSSLAEVFDPVTKSERALVAKCFRELTEVGATGDDVRSRATEAWSRWQRAFTPEALLKHWSSLGRANHGGSKIRDSFARYKQLYGVAGV